MVNTMEKLKFQNVLHLKYIHMYIEEKSSKSILLKFSAERFSENVTQ